MAKQPIQRPGLNADVPRTRGGWVPVGTAVARRAKIGEGTTERGRLARREIVAAARRVFERDGYLDARVEDIVIEAGVARGSFYSYFPSKREVFKEIAADVGGEIARAVQRSDRSSSNALETLEASNRRYLDVYRANSRIVGLIEQVSTIDPEIHEARLRSRQSHVRRVARTIRRWQQCGRADPEIDPVTTAAALVSMLSNFAYWWLAAGDSYDEALVARTLTSIWARAVGLEPGPDRPERVSAM
jgi:AcrR family transcriptional regulator